MVRPGRTLRDSRRASFRRARSVKSGFDDQIPSESARRTGDHQGTVHRDDVPRRSCRGISIVPRTPYPLSECVGASTTDDSLPRRTAGILACIKGWRPIRPVAAKCFSALRRSRQGCLRYGRMGCMTGVPVPSNRAMSNSFEKHCSQSSGTPAALRTAGPTILNGLMDGWPRSGRSKEFL